MGRWIPSPAGKEQSHELQVERVKILGDNDAAVRSTDRIQPIESADTFSVIRHIPFRKNTTVLNSYEPYLTCDPGYPSTPSCSVSDLKP